MNKHKPGLLVFILIKISTILYAISDSAQSVLFGLYFGLKTWKPSADWPAMLAGRIHTKRLY